MRNEQASASAASTSESEAHELADLGVVAAAAFIRNGDITSESYSAALLHRARRYSDLNSFITIDESAVLTAARDADKARAAGSTAPLLGVPLGVKDSYATRGLRTTLGMGILGRFTPNEDAEFVIAIKDAGGIVFGKNNNLGRHVQQVGGDPQDAIAGETGRPPLAPAGLLVRLGLHQDDPDRMIGPRVGLVRGLWLHHDIAEHARPSRRLRDGPLLADLIEVAVIADAADVTAAGCDDDIPPGELGVPAVHHVTVSRLQRFPQDLFLVGLTAVECGGDLDAGRQTPIDIEVGMEPPAAARLAVLVAEVGRLGQRGQGLAHAAIDGGEHLADVLLAHAAGRGDLGPEFGDDRFEPLVI